MLSQKALEEFKAIWKEEKGEDISDDFAVREATSLLSGVDAIYRPIKTEWLSDDDKKIYGN